MVFLMTNNIFLIDLNNFSFIFKEEKSEWRGKEKNPETHTAVNK